MIFQLVLLLRKLPLKQQIVRSSLELASFMQKQFLLSTKKTTHPQKLHPKTPKPTTNIHLPRNQKLGLRHPAWKIYSEYTRLSGWKWS